MPTFPPVRTVIAQAMVLPTPTLMGGVSLDATRYPLANLVDQTSKTAWRSLDTNVGLRFDLGVATEIGFVGVIGHNLTPGTLCSIHASNSTGTLDVPSLPPDDEYSDSWVTTQVLSRAFGSRPPNCWVDVRDAAGVGTTARYWQLHVHDNGVPVTLSEVVMGVGQTFDGTVSLPFNEVLTAVQSRKDTEYGSVLVSATGVVQRALSLKLSLTIAEQALLRSLYENIWATDALRAVVIPSTRVNDLWYVELPNLDVTSYPDALVVGEHTLDMTEEVFGVV